jgi:hypothetical protein
MSWTGMIMGTCRVRRGLRGHRVCLYADLLGMTQWMFVHLHASCAPAPLKI